MNNLLPLPVLLPLLGAGLALIARPPPAGPAGRVHARCCSTVVAVAAMPGRC